MGSTVHILHRLTGVTVAAADAENTIGMAKENAIGMQMAAGPDRGTDQVLKNLLLHPKGRLTADRDAVECHDPRLSDFVTANVRWGRARSELWILFHFDLDKPELERVLTYHIMGHTGIASVGSARDKFGVAG